jgi:glycerophosphoryl diester phosphodiesterase
LSAGADGIELDVRLARDGVPVVIHDATLRRTALVSGSIHRLDSHHLARTNVGTWFNRANPKFARDGYTEEHIPTLEQVFKLCRNRRATIYVEMKSESDATARDLAHAVAKLVKSFKFHDHAVVISFDLAAIATVRELDNSIRTGALFGSNRMAGRNWRRNILAAASDSGANELVLNHLLARRKLIEKAHDAGLPVAVWTVDDAKWIERARLLGIQALITNQPAKLVAAI